MAIFATVLLDLLFEKTNVSSSRARVQPEPPMRAKEFTICMFM